MSNTEVLQVVRKRIDASKLVRQAFRGSGQMSSYVQDMLNPGDTQVTEMRLNPLSLEMRDLILEKKFKASKID